jgi:predicted TIM-barrel fold metal-dependent hydrolase
MKDGYIIVDADTHVMEPGDLWDTYLEEKYRDRPLRVVREESGDILIVNGHPSRFTKPPALAMINGMGKTWEQVLEQQYLVSSEFGTRQGRERYEMQEANGVDYTVVFASLGLAWNAEADDPELGTAYCRAYNRWIVDFCADSKFRAVPIAMIWMDDDEHAGDEVRRAVEDGCKGIWLPHTNNSARAHGNPEYDRFWAQVEEVGVPVAIHPCVEKSKMRVHQRFDDLRGWARWYFNVCGSMSSQMALAALFQWGLFDRFPKLKVALIEAGAGWLPHFVHRMDEAAECSVGSTLQLQEKPSTYFQTNVWYSADADEPGYDYMVERLGSEHLMWGSDYPHFDHSELWLDEIMDRTSKLDATARRNVLGLNALKLWDLPHPDRRNSVDSLVVVPSG